VADARWKESNERLREISENIRDVFYFVTPDSSQFLYVSPAYEQVWGRPVAELYADPLSWSRAIHPEDRDAAVQLFLGGMTQGGFNAEYRISHPDGSTRWISTHGNPILDQNGSVVRVIGIAMDITEAKHSELENRRLADRLVTTMEIISDAMFTLDLEGQITYINREVESQLGRARQDLLGKNFWDALPDVMGTITEYSFREARSSMKTIEFERYYDPLNKWFAARLYPHEEGTVAYFRDITDAKQAEEEYRRHTTRLRALSRRLFQAEEEERRRLGRELHDQAGANLTAMALSLELLRRRIPEPEDGEIGIWFREFDAILQDTIRHVRTVLTDLRPAALDDLGLLAALRHYVQRTLSLTSIKVQIEGTEPVPRLEPDVAIALFRVVQEALTNVVKHSQASLATISLMGASDRLTLTVEDNGLGFSHDSALKDTASLGMTTMQERVEAIGARLSVRSAPGHGTIVTIELPTKVAGQIVPDTAESAH
jgi:PAS domain S-box-containing protein